MLRVPSPCVAFIACLASTGARTDEFAWELTSLVSEADEMWFQETDYYELQATHFFDPVDDASGPYALASFFDPATRASLAVSRERRTVAAGTGPVAGNPGGGPITLPPGFFVPVVVEADAYTLGGRYVLPESKWYFGGSYTKSDIGDRASFAQPEERYGVLVGKYLGSATTLEVAWNTNETEREFPRATICPGGQPCIDFGIGTNKRQQEHASVSVLHVRRLRSMTYSLSGRIAGSRANVSINYPEVTLPPPVSITLPALDLSASLPRLQSYSVGGELFPTAKLGVRIGYTRWDDDTHADDAYDVVATWFVRRDFGLQFIYSQQSLDDGTAPLFFDDDFKAADTVAIRLVGRF